MSSEFLLRVALGLTTILVSIGGVWLSRRGQHDTREAQSVANKLQERVQDFNEMSGLAEKWKAYAEALDDRLNRMGAQHTDEITKQAARCQAQLDSLIDNVATLQSIVSDEIARTAALDSVRDAQDHEAEDHGRSWQVDEPRY